ncbi:MAG: type II toxin-antitoxin system RelE/ParE family toxin [Nanoarchaeota archaeon]|nr:type II toxin-antitoxin system RelE/ParE family toxin [Nanoarchaeota archaeon]
MYKIIFDLIAERFLRKLDGTERKRINKKFRELEKNPRMGKPLTGNFAGLFSLRIGKYRAIYKVYDGELLVMVIDIGHRKNIY